MEHTYIVHGLWRFPLDMLRHDQARPATPKDAALIERMSSEEKPEPGTLATKISLIIDTGEVSEAYPYGRHLPDAARWKRFNWHIVGGDDTLRHALGRVPETMQEGLARFQAQAEQEMVAEAAPDLLAALKAMVELYAPKPNCAVDRQAHRAIARATDEEFSNEVWCRDRGWDRAGDGEGIIWHTGYWDSWKQAMSYAGEADDGDPRANVFDDWGECRDFMAAAAAA